MVAEMELGFIRDRQRAGIEAAKAKGIYKGRLANFRPCRIVALRKERMGATRNRQSRGLQTRERLQDAHGCRVERR
jgi:DNA invertase Pin-like site-specific DNA recombinase